jgi:hypothetical protein
VKRGSDIHEAYRQRILADRMAQHNTGGCIWCPDFKPQGTLAETSAACLAHRLEHHPHVKPRKHERRIVPMVTLAGGKTLDENIANAREQGAATWDGAA